MKNPHQEEICYWGKHPIGTKVWVKDNEVQNDNWDLIDYPAWQEGFEYVTDDEWADLRKAQIDGNQLQFQEMDYTLELIYINASQVSDWRIKPEEPLYEWQWIIQRPNGDYWITSDFYIDKNELEYYMPDIKIIERYKPSKRERK